MNKTRSKVMTIANRLVKQGLTRSIATVKAWIIVKANALRTKVKGTSRRQSALEKLAGVNPADISVKLKREPRNAHDSNAVAVYAALRDSRVFFIGYLPKAVASVLAPLMDKNDEPSTKAFRVTGGFNPYVNYGAALAIAV
ncbi:MAG: HIRAN domain-containing protein [Oscillospiraceae bacterium]|nr:HIRAN domain-containing protein [Oscillospiraceae bacterium]